MYIPRNPTAAEIEAKSKAAQDKADKFVNAFKSGGLKAALAANSGPVKPRSEDRLPVWVDAVRGVPNCLLRGALFPVNDERAVHEQRTSISSVAGYEMFQTRTGFIQDDLDVLGELFHLARLQPLDQALDMTGGKLLKSLGRSTAGSQYRQLQRDLARLSGSTVEIKMKDVCYVGSFIQNYYYDDSTKRYIIKLDPNILKLFDAGITFIDAQQRKALGKNSLAKWLHGFYSSNKTPYALKVETIRLHSGSRTELNGFKRMLEKALDRLVSAGCIQDNWKIDGDLVTAVKTARKRYTNRTHFQSN